MRHPAGQKLYSYWEALRRDRVAPERDEIDPGAVRAVLADTFVLEYAPEERFPMRIAGGRTEALFLRQLRGASFLSLWRRDDASQVADILGYVADESAPFIVGDRKSTRLNSSHRH